MALPIGGDGSSRARYRLIDWMTSGWVQQRSIEELAGAVVVKPVFARFEALQHGMLR
jgi:hypothetical protein